ncbi:hypothetical protein BH11ARM2_BH11ARM2_38650 [soil metagenome]
MNAERRLAADFAQGRFEAYRASLSPDFRFYPNGGLKPAGKGAFIDSQAKYRKGIRKVEQKVKLIRGTVRGKEVNVLVETTQSADALIGGKIRRVAYKVRMNDRWIKTPIGYLLVGMKPAFKGPAAGIAKNISKSTLK